jgi:hypothetical protein
VQAGVHVDGDILCLHSMLERRPEERRLKPMASPGARQVDPQAREGNPGARKPYASPALHVYGALRDITTHLSTMLNMDGGAGAMSMS